MLSMLNCEFRVVNLGLTTSGHGVETELGFVKTVSKAEIGHDCSLNHTHNLFVFVYFLSSLKGRHWHEGFEFLWVDESIESNAAI